MFHSPSPSLFGRSPNVLSEYRALRSTVVELRRVCVSLAGDAPRAFVDAKRALSELSELSSVYFDAGETAAQFRVITEECPSLEGRAGSVAHDREILKESVTGLHGYARRANAACLATRIRTVLDQFERHELAESELLRDFFERAGEVTSTVGHEARE